MWIGQQTQLNGVARADHNLAWLNLVFLAAVAVLPFTTSLLASFITYRVALLAYLANILLLGGALYATVSYGFQAGLMRADVPPDMRQIIRRRIIVAQGLYAAGAALCIVSTQLSIVFIVIVQLNYALGLRLPVLSRAPDRLPYAQVPPGC